VGVVAGEFVLGAIRAENRAACRSPTERGRKMKPKLYTVNSIADVLDAVKLFAIENCTAARPCLSRSCFFYSWCPKASKSIDPDHSWVHRVEARRRKAARDKARKAAAK
jgi:hypothetical protein